MVIVEDMGRRCAGSDWCLCVFERSQYLELYLGIRQYEWCF